MRSGECYFSSKSIVQFYLFQTAPHCVDLEEKLYHMDKFEDSSLLHCLTVVESCWILLSIFISLNLVQELGVEVLFVSRNFYKILMTLTTTKFNFLSTIVLYDQKDRVIAESSEFEYKPYVHLEFCCIIMV